LFESCHQALRRTRGVAMSVAAFDGRASTMDWCGVGNVDGVLLRDSASGSRRAESLVSRGGVVGYRLPPLKVSTVAVAEGDLLLLATDGIRTDFVAAVMPSAEPQAIADSVLARCAKSNDDALVFVARYLAPQVTR
jgi:hypothetical protein